MSKVMRLTDMAESVDWIDPPEEGEEAV
jgi:hypothetical protein